MAVLGAATQDFASTAEVVGNRHKAGHDTIGKNRAMAISATHMV
jgi:hypothetical protein